MNFRRAQVSENNIQLKYLFLSLLFVVFLGCDKNKNAQTDVAKKDIVLNNATESSNFTSNNDIKYALEQLDNTKGLSNSSVNCIFQDSQKLLWIGTWDGLNRYDGSNFKIFRPEANDENSLSNQVILKIGEDNAGQIWILTIHGINRYDKKKDLFQHYYFSRKNKPPLSESEFNMALDGSKHVFCAVKDWGIGYFDGTDFKSLETKEFSFKAVSKIEFSASGKLLALLDNNKLYALTIADFNGKKSISKIDLVSDGIRTFDVLPNQEICTVSIAGDVVLSSSDGNIKQSLRYKNIESIVGHYPQGIVLSGKSGYFITDFNGKDIVSPWSKYLKNHKITTLIQGNENVIWTGTDGDGLFKMYPIKKSFNLISKAQLPELDGGIVRAFLETDKNSVWIGTKGKGLFKISDGLYNTDKPLVYEKFDESNGLINNSVFSLAKGNDDLIFIGTDGKGITVYDLQKSKLISWDQIENAEKNDYFKSVYAIHQDKNGFLWLGTNGYGMISCKIIRSSNGLKITDFKRYSAGNGEENKLSSNIVFSIVSKDDGHLWIGTRLGGLNLFDKKSGTFRSYKNSIGNPKSLSSNDILCLANDERNGKLWIGTSFGLNLLEELKNDGSAVFKNFTVKDGLPNNTIHGIIPYEKSNLWLSTNFGLSNFVINPEKFTNYSKNEGLQNNEFADGAFYSNTDSGLIFMGGIKGFNYFLPQKIKESTVIPDLLIDKISGQNKELPYYQGLIISPDSKTFPSIVLKHNQNFFDVHLAALTFTNNEKCQYAYQLEGFDKGWNNIGNRTIISFTNVPRGKYSMWIKWSNADGVWSDPVRAIDIKIKPVFWQSNSAVLVYAILLMFFILFVRSYYFKRQSLNQNIIFRKKEEELHENRLTFFTNIAHEFLTPLTLIVGPSQKLSELKNLDEKSQKFIRLIERNATRLLVLTQQLLEFRKAEYDYLDITVKEFDLVNLVEQIAELFDDWAFDKNIDFKVDFPPQLMGWYDKDKIEKIIFNLMSNAFKYTPRDGKIYLKCQIENSDLSKLSITVINTGKGIPKEKLNSLFDRFFLSDADKTSDPEVLRTGIGLAYIKRLVTVLRGEITVSSVPDKETTFTILLPCLKSSFEPREIDTDPTTIVISRHLKNILAEIEEKPEDVPQKIVALEQIENDRKSILIVEDDKEIHVFLNQLLETKYKILSAYNGVEALEIIENKIPDIIISDVMMPLMDGVELCRKVKTDLKTCHVPFIMLTAKESVLHRIEGLESGANSYIPKPFYPDHLLVRIQKLLEEKELIVQHFSQDAEVGNFAQLGSDNNQKAFMRQVIELIKKNVDNENLQSSFIEKALGISNSQLYRKTKDIFGLSPGDLIRTIRLKYAAELLRKNEMTVSEVCYQSGFNNRSYFYREFKKVYNSTPKNYQLDHKSKRTSFLKN